MPRCESTQNESFTRFLTPYSLGLALSSLTSLTQFLALLLMVMCLSIESDSSLTFIFQSLAMVENGSVAVSRIHEVVTLPVEPDSALEISNGEEQELKDWPARGGVQFDSVQLRYK